jgi:predicted methyltransferase
MTDAATLLVALGVTCAYAADIGYLAPPGAPAKVFASPQRPVAQIVSPSRSAEERRDSLNESGEIARRLELKSGMTVGDIGAGSGYHTRSASRASSAPPAPSSPRTSRGITLSSSPGERNCSS